jgi:hypothetical protein
MLPVDPVFPVPAEFQVPVTPVTSDSNLFNLLTGSCIMKVINTDLVPIMIATEGTDFFDKNNTEKALQTSLLRRDLGGS